ncbi:MAG: hypothetical protein IPO58_21110 [Betaproteobacteria bacterium]|nr:hypothetical protein [Betaproteobacteria bacterium]
MGGDFRGRGREVPQECWNPRARHYEGLRPGERQDDLDLNRCRPIAQRGSERRGNVARECWNPGARHYENVREGERQDDLDFQPLPADRATRSEPANVPRECWNPRAGHFENVREGERQDDLDFHALPPALKAQGASRLARAGGTRYAAGIDLSAHAT